MFISLEGIEGAGKTSQIQNIVDLLEARGYECLTTREPGGTAIGAQIRGVLLDPANRGLDPGAELLLYVADRIQHIQTVISPQLQDGKVVLCDRFFDATLESAGDDPQRDDDENGVPDGHCYRVGQQRIELPGHLGRRGTSEAVQRLEDVRQCPAGNDAVVRRDKVADD